MFENIFTSFYAKNNEIKLMGVWGKDGLELEKTIFHELAGIDLDLTGAELADIISKLEGMKLSPEKYYIKLNYHGYLLLIFSLTADFFLMVVADPGIIAGKLTFYVNLYKEKLLSAL